jgi:hypothetical protein
MSQRAVTSLPMAFEVLKAMRKGRPWIGARVIVQSAPQRVLSTDLLTELGDIELNVPGPAATARPRLFAPMRGARGRSTGSSSPASCSAYRRARWARRWWSPSPRGCCSNSGVSPNSSNAVS